MSYLRNVWYIVGWSDEFMPQKMVSKTFLDEPIVMFRDTRNQLRALQDRCPHRFVPLHLGRLRDDRIQCAYHGLEFDCSGACVRNPHGDGAIPKAAKVRSYPMHEAHGFAWIWMGEAEAADPGLIPDFSPMGPDVAYVGKSYLHVKANYVLETDNILDLSHIEFLHGSTLGSDAVAQGKIDVTQEGNTVYSKRLTCNERLTPSLERLRGVAPGQRVDRWLDVRWDAPANMLLISGQTQTGQPREAGSQVHVAHMFTPETSSTTHYWFGIAIPKSQGEGGAERARANIEWLQQPFANEDMPMLEAQQNTVGDREFWSLKPVLLPSDAGAVRARRVLERMIKQEREAI